MKKPTSIILLLLIFSSGNFAQVLNTSGILKEGQISVGVEPGIYINGGTDFNLFLHGGVGITSVLDLAAKLGVMGNHIYIGGDAEFAVARRFSISAGAHSYENFGLDLTGLLTLLLGSPASLNSGLDLEVNFPDRDVQVPLWIPLGLEIPIRKYILFFFETEVNITSAGNHFIGSGLSFLF
jgi:hypothetical protein